MLACLLTCSDTAGNASARKSLVRLRAPCQVALSGKRAELQRLNLPSWRLLIRQLGEGGRSKLNCPPPTRFPRSSAPLCPASRLTSPGTSRSRSAVNRWRRCRGDRPLGCLRSRGGGGGGREGCLNNCESSACRYLSRAYAQSQRYT